LPKLNLKFDLKTTMSCLAGGSIVLSLAHHWVNFWGLSLLPQLLIAIPGTLLAGFFIYWFLLADWSGCLSIDRRRWLLFLLPALGLAVAAALYLFSPPTVWHTLEIRVVGTSPARILEIKVPGDTVRLPDLDLPAGWTLEGDALVTTTPQPGLLRYTFLGLVDRPVTVLFAEASQGARVSLNVDGNLAQADLTAPQPGNRQLQVDTRYRFGIPGPWILALIFVIDVLAFLFLLTFAWLIQELPRAARDTVTGERFLSHRAGLAILLVAALSLHLLNILSVTLLVSSDTLSYLQGAIYWLRYHTLDGVSPIRGPGSTFLFLPALLLTGTNPWGMKILLHLVAIACVPVSYRLGWQLGGRRWFAFAAGLIALLTPDLFFYSNFVMSDLPNAFLGLLFCTLLISSLQTLSWKWLLATMLVASFAALFRPENTALFALAAGFWSLKLLWDRFRSALPVRLMGVRFGHLALVVVVAALPLVWWSLHNASHYDFFGLSNAAGADLYDGWIYYGENSHVQITDPASPAQRIIESAYRPQPGDPTRAGAPTSWDIYRYLLKAGYTDNQSQDILGQAALAAILRDRATTLRLLDIKIHKGFTPEMVNVPLLPLPGDPLPPAGDKGYFDPESLSIPPLIRLHQALNAWLAVWYQYCYPALIFFSLLMIPLGLYRRPFFTWVPVVTVTLMRILIPTILAMSLWRYIVSGVVLMQIFALAGVESLVLYILFVIRHYRAR
jgi:hypothetical protein